MKRLIRPLAWTLIYCLGVAAFAYAAGGSAGVPLWQRRLQGNGRAQYSVVCGTDTALLTAAQTANALSIFCENMETTSTNRVGICPRAAAAGACDSVAKYGWRLLGDGGFTTDMSAGGAYSCNGTSYRVNCVVENFYDIDPQHPTPVAPTPIPTPT